MTEFLRRDILTASTAIIGAAALSNIARAAAEPPLNDRLTGYLTGLHDPVIVREGDRYHVFGSGGWNHNPQVSWRTSTDLTTWTDNGPPFAAPPKWAFDAIKGAESMWAPDISYLDGRFHLYYAVSTGGSMRSVIGYASTPTLDKTSPRYGWTDHGLVTETFVGGTYNAIDPNHVVDLQGNRWLAFGSYWSGLKLMPLDRHTGKPARGAELNSIAYRPAPTGGDNPIEGAFIVIHDNVYYLFASYDYCCRGADSSYYVAVGRSRDIRGPYAGRDGKLMMDGYGTAVIVERPWASTNWRGPGHCGLMHDAGGDLIVYHAYDVKNKAAPTLRLARLTWDVAGWPQALV